MSEKVWNERDYQLALSVVGQIRDPAEKERITRKLRQYEQSRITGTGFAGVEAMQAAPMGLTEPEEEKAVDVGAVAKSMAVTPKAGKVGAGSIAGSLWHEPSLERFRLDMAPEVGVAVEQMDESSPLYQAYANRKWNEAAAKAEKAGQDLVRVSQMPTDTWGDKALSYGAKARDLADTLLLGADETATAGVGNEAAIRAQQALGINPDARAQSEEALARNPLTRDVGNVLGYLNPFAPAMIGGRAAINAVGPKLGALASKVGGGALARGAAKAGTAAAGGAAALATEGAAQDILPKLLETPGETMANPFEPQGFLRRRTEEAKLGAVAGPAAELVGGLAGKAAGKLAEGARKKAAAALENPAAGLMGLSQQDMARLIMWKLGGGVGPLALSAAGRSGPALEQIAKLQSVRGINPFIPGFPGGAMASPLLQEGASQAPTNQGDLEAIQKAIEEASGAPAETPPEAPTDEIPEGYELVPEGAGTEPIGFFNDLHEGVMGLSDMQQQLFGKSPPRPPAASYKQDPEFMALLAKIPSVTNDPDTAKDQAAGYIEHYAQWRKLTNEARAAGEPEPDFSRAFMPKFNAKGFNRTLLGDELAGEVGVYSDLPVPANKQIGEWEDVRSEQSRLPTAGERAAFDKSLPKGADTEKIVKTMATRLRAGASMPSPNLVYESLKEIGYNVPLADVKRLLRSYLEVEL